MEENNKNENEVLRRVKSNDVEKMYQHTDKIVIYNSKKSKISLTLSCFMNY